MFFSLKKFFWSFIHFFHFSISVWMPWCTKYMLYKVLLLFHLTSLLLPPATLSFILCKVRGVGKIRLTVVSLFLQYYLLILVLFICTTTVSLLLLTPVFLDWFILCLNGFHEIFFTFSLFHFFFFCICYAKGEKSVCLKYNESALIWNNWINKLQCKPMLQGLILF